MHLIKYDSHLFIFIHDNALLCNGKEVFFTTNFKFFEFTFFLNAVVVNLEAQGLGNRVYADRKNYELLRLRYPPPTL